MNVEAKSPELLEAKPESPDFDATRQPVENVAGRQEPISPTPSGGGICPRLSTRDLGSYKRFGQPRVLSWGAATSIFISYRIPPARR